MALLSAQAVVRAGTEISFDAATAGGDTFRPVNDRAKLLVNNSSGGAVDVTISTPGTVAGLDIDDNVVECADGEITAIPLYKQLYADPSDGEIDIAYESVSSVTVAVITD